MIDQHDERTIARLRAELAEAERAVPTIDDLRAQLAALDGAVRRRERDLAIATEQEQAYDRAVGAIDEQLGRLLAAHGVRVYTNENGTIRVLDCRDNAESVRRPLEHQLTALGRRRYQLQQERDEWLKEHTVRVIDGLQRQAVVPMTATMAGNALWHAKNYRDQTVAALEGR